MKLMRSRYRGRCDNCGERFGPGTLINYDSKAPRGQKTTHAECHADGSEDYASEGSHGDYGSQEWNNRPTIEVRTSSGTFYQRAGGRCEDAPCCGCCTF